jgi:hypothetical protein
MHGVPLKFLIPVHLDLALVQIHVNYNLPHDKWNQTFTLTFDNQYIVGTGFDQVIHRSQRFTREGNNTQALQVVPVILAWLSSRKLVPCDADLTTGQRLGLVPVNAIRQPGDNTFPVLSAFRQRLFLPASVPALQVPVWIPNYIVTWSGIGKNPNPSVYAVDP